MFQKFDRVSFRLACHEDVSAWVGPLERVANPVPWTEHLLGGEVNSPHSTFWVAEVAGAPAGFVIVHTVGDEAEILEIAVMEAHRRSGVGRSLMEQACRTARAHHCGALFLEVRPGNAPARALYEGLGFQAIGLRKRYYRDNGEDAIVMRLDLFPAT